MTERRNRLKTLMKECDMDHRRWLSFAVCNYLEDAIALKVQLLGKTGFRDFILDFEDAALI
jgi:hypothetical protein